MKILTVIAVLGCAGQSAAVAPPDNIAPVVTCPANITAPSSVPTVVNYAGTCTDSGGVQTFACVPPSGATFPPGPTSVTCTCVDLVGNMSTCTFTVTVDGPPVPQGGACTDTAQCVAGLFCSDAVCCDSACPGPGRSCDLPGQVGTCATAPAAAPAASPVALFAMLAALILTAFVALQWRRRA